MTSSLLLSNILLFQKPKIINHHAKEMLEVLSEK